MGEHHVPAQCAPPVSTFAKYLKPVSPSTTTLHESIRIAAGIVMECVVGSVIAECYNAVRLLTGMTLAIVQE